ncbi:hypothetical protein EDD18DRAFT_1356099 [Armillaria luteobubalina]|uniref:Uncharacterized protein n=1 Tax=Armillaria luteobubalina TaxID=153913 RepID=A0AA39Q1X7_9AGAR|nr:hypothetical protein EDD18DRAFT_1356099 [Armillaria luteobubalina]
MQFNIFQHFRSLSTYIRGGSSTGSVSMSGQGYTPRGPPAQTIKGSVKNGGGPKGGNGGQNNNRTGSAGNSK